MVGHFVVSADYGWLQSKDGAEMAHVLFKAGKGQDSYFMTDNIITYANLAMDILKKHFPHDDHILVFDNVMWKQLSCWIERKGWVKLMPSCYV